MTRPGREPTSYSVRGTVPHIMGKSVVCNQNQNFLRPILTVAITVLYICSLPVGHRSLPTEDLTECHHDSFEVERVRSGHVFSVGSHSEL